MIKYPSMRVPVLCFAACILLSCGSIVYRQDIVQGNILDKDDLSLLQVGMSRDEVRSILGNPLADNVFREDSWHYVHSVNPGTGITSSRTIILHFRDDVLTHISGSVVAGSAVPDAAEAQQRVVRVPDPPKTGIFGGLLKGRNKRTTDSLPVKEPETPGADDQDVDL